MPRYTYRCSECEELSIIFHLSDEIESTCPRCDAPAALIRVLSSFTTSGKHITKIKVGCVTEDFIDDARQELHQQKKDLDNNR